MAEVYTPPIDVAFKKRIIDKVGTAIAENIISDILNNIPDRSLSNGEQRVVLPDAVIQGLNHELMEKTIISVVLNGELQNKQSISGMETLGEYAGKTIYGVLLDFADYGVNADDEFLRFEAIEDAPTPEDWEE